VAGQAAEIGAGGGGDGQPQLGLVGAARQGGGGTMYTGQGGQVVIDDAGESGDEQDRPAGPGSSGPARAAAGSYAGLSDSEPASFRDRPRS
jgi:hypothetical protein